MTNFTLTTGGASTKYLSEDGTYTIPAGGSGLDVSVPSLPYNLIPENRSGTTIRFYPGKIIDSTGTQIITIASAIDVICTNNGAAGLDTGSLVNNTRYYWYAMKALTGQTTVIASTQISAALVTKPTTPVDYTGCYIAKIPMGLVYRSTYGFPDFRIKGWCSKFPEFFYNDIDYTGWSFLVGGTATTMTSVNLYTGTQNWVPENSRTVTIGYILTSTTGAGDFKTRLNAGSTYDKRHCTIKAGGVQSGSFDQVLTSSGDFKYSVPANTSIEMWVTHYTMSEA